MNTLHKDDLEEASPKKHSLAEAVFSRIESEDISPRSRIFFRSQECLVWFLWGVSVILGVLSVAVSVFVLTHAQYAMYEATHDNFLTFMVEFLPYAWMAVFAIMVMSAHYNFRHTRHGYRYRFSHILLSSLIFSLAGGFALQYFGMGYYLDHELGRWMPMYTSMEAKDIRLWQQPEDGRLVGKMVLVGGDSQGLITFIDVEGMEWQVAVLDLYEADVDLLETGRRVKLVGVRWAADKFHSCGVYPWLYDWSVSLNELANERKEFITRMMAHRKSPEERSAIYEEAVYTSASRFAPMGACAEMALIGRLRE